MSYTAHPGMRVGHVHLKVSDLERSVRWYGDVLGFEVMQKVGDQAAFLSAGGYHHHLGLNTWQSRGGVQPPKGSTGLFHAAFLYPDRAALAAVVANVVAHDVPLLGASDHGVSEAVYLEDPDGNGIELYRDRAMDDWPRDADGGLSMVSKRLDVEALVAEAA
ncbi:MAG: VOC family protein [Pseudomonadota bacterium]